MRLGGCQRLGGARDGALVFSEYRVSLWEDENVLRDGGDGYVKV